MNRKGIDLAGTNIRGDENLVENSQIKQRRATE